jgi:hypothetical protein
LSHWLDVLLRSRRGRTRAELSARIYKDLGATGGRSSADSRDESGSNIRIADPDSVALARHTRNVVADIDIVIAARQVRAGNVAQGGAVIAGVVEKRYVATSIPTFMSTT